MLLSNVFERNLAPYKNPQKKYIINQGGTSAGKTISILQLLTQVAIKYKKQIDVFGQTVPHLKQGVLNDMVMVLEGFGLSFDDMYNKGDKCLTFKSGSVINFIAIDKIGKAKGPRRDIAFFNEANHIHYNIAEQIMLRTREEVFIDYNPTNEFWVHKKLMKEEADRCEFIKSTYLDNSALSEEEIKTIERKRGDGKNNFWRVYGMGELGKAEGLIFNNYKELNFDKYQFEKYLNGVDWGFSQDPFAFVRVAVHKGDLYICDEFYQKNLLNKDSAPMIKPLVRNELVFCDSAEPKSVSEYRSLEINAVPAKKGPGSIESGIKKIQSYNNVFIHPSCKNVLVEFGHYQWKVDKNNDPLNIPEDSFNHAIDAIRYALSTEMNYSPAEYEINTNPYESGSHYGGSGWMA